MYLITKLVPCLRRAALTCDVARAVTTHSPGQTDVVEPTDVGMGVASPAPTLLRHLARPAARRAGGLRRGPVAAGRAFGACGTGFHAWGGATARCATKAASSSAICALVVRRRLAVNDAGDAVRPWRGARGWAGGGRRAAADAFTIPPAVVDARFQPRTVPLVGSGGGSAFSRGAIPGPEGEDPQDTSSAAKNVLPPRSLAIPAPALLRMRRTESCCSAAARALTLLGGRPLARRAGANTECMHRAASRLRCGSPKAKDLNGVCLSTLVIIFAACTCVKGLSAAPNVLRPCITPHNRQQRTAATTPQAVVLLQHRA